MSTRNTPRYTDAEIEDIAISAMENMPRNPGDVSEYEVGLDGWERCDDMIAWSGGVFADDERVGTWSLLEHYPVVEFHWER